MLTKRITTILFILMTIMSSSSIFGKDVKDMGNVWVVTIDKSGSMTWHGRTPARLGEDVRNRLLYGGALDGADFQKDRFLFLTSGFPTTSHESLRKSEPFDKSFIHKTDGKLHSFKNKRDCANYISRIVASNDYKHDLSFVSQIRVFSIIHAVNFLKDSGEGDNFDQLKVLTITDDADQNDQWRMDERNLKQAAPNKVKEVNDSTAKYIYNSLNGTGKGYLNCAYSDEKNTPHIWVYDYKSKSSDALMIERDLFSIHPTSGTSLSINSKVSQLDGDDVDYFYITSVHVNGIVQPVSGRFSSAFNKPCVYLNYYGKNNVDIWGYAQVGYQDPIYGPHHKIVPFVQHQTVISNDLSNLIHALYVLLIIAVVALILFFLIIRPNSTLFTVYSEMGGKTIVKRGYSSSWKGANIPLQCYQANRRDGPIGYMTRKDRFISRGGYSSESLYVEDGILLISHTPLCLSVNNAVAIDTSLNIDQVLSERQGKYSNTLKSLYKETVFSKLYRHSSSKPIALLIKLLNFFHRTYYYYIPSVAEAKRILIRPEKSLKDKRFSIEYYCYEPDIKFNLSQLVINPALSHYYRSSSRYDIIACNYRFGDSIFWCIVQLNDDSVSGNSLREVRQLVSFEQETSESPETFLPVIKRYLRKQFPGMRIGYIEEDEESRDVSFYVSFAFNVTPAAAPAFITFIEDTKKRRAQTLYSPFSEPETTEKFVRLNHKLSSGHLYASIIPVFYLKKYPSLIKKLSENVINNDVKISSLLTIGKDGFTFRETFKY